MQLCSLYKDVCLKMYTKVWEKIELKSPREGGWLSLVLSLICSKLYKLSSHVCSVLWAVKHKHLETASPYKRQK
jgi:hypothetical protein